MAHFAEIDSNNVVLRVLVVDNAHEDRGAEYLADDCGLGGTWVQTSYNATFGGKFAGAGDTWDGTNFVSPPTPEPVEPEPEVITEPKPEVTE